MNIADLELERHDRVLLARLNRPDKINAQSEEMLDLLEESFTIQAGPRGAEALVLQYPRGDIE